MVHSFYCRGREQPRPFDDAGVKARPGAGRTLKGTRPSGWGRNEVEEPEGLAPEAAGSCHGEGSKRCVEAADRYDR